MEKDDELKGIGNSYDFGARMLDSRVGRWFAPDKEEEEFPWQSPYVLNSNSPIFKLDPDGNWDIEVHAHKNRGKHGYATMIVKDNDGKIVYRTIVKAVGSHRVRNKGNGDTPVGKYKILGYRKTGTKGEILKNGKPRYPVKSFGSNALLALDYQGKEGGSREGMHVHGGRGYYKDGKELMSTHGCLRINDGDIAQIKKVTDKLEKEDPSEKRGYLTVSDDLKKSVKYSDDRHNEPNNNKAVIVDVAGDGYTNMRPSPGSGDPTRVNAGSNIEVLEKGEKYSKIKYDGNEGYVPSRYIKTDSE